MNKKFIVVEGVIGAGKTTLTNILSEYYNAEKILEEVETNPFLSNFYKDRKSYAFQTQIYFLLSRYKQMSKFKQLNLFNNTIISDYLFDKDYIFAEINLDDNEFNMYKSIYNLMKAQLTTPDLVIYLQGSLETLIKHIKMRGRSFESNISHNYLKTLNEKYNEFFFKYNNSPLLIINIDKVDFVKENFDFNYFIKEIETDFSGKKFLSF
ncbi:deoxynucleoside kinase [candidate division TA06 bacterium]|uniref:Deoxynucleoside kinase n=1 Tax=candidate division TA06 bacterium TaxID=2250710 RepID=A0A660SAZ2_UNCT6|nr:MAG: deoxynucleoside kinase [candidate division TA06 bacterium]